MNSKLINNRNIVLDWAKTIAIILVVIGHSIQYGSGYNYWINSNYLNNIVFKFIYSFHMPLFMLISGYLFYNSINKYSVKELIKKKTTSLLVPILSFSTLELLFVTLFQHQSITIHSIIDIYTDKLWFLWAAYILSLLVIFTNRVFKDNIIIYALLIILTFFTPSFLKLIGFMLPFFIIGYLYNKYRVNFNNKISNNVLLTILLIIYIVLLCFYNENCYIFTSGLSILNNLKQFPIDLYRYLIGLVGSGLCICLIKAFNNYKYKKVLLVGQYSLGIYTISSYIFIYAIKPITSSFTGLNYLYMILESIIVLATTLIIIILFKKSKILSILFLGKTNTSK